MYPADLVAASATASDLAWALRSHPVLVQGDEAQEHAAARVDDLASDAERHKVTGLALSLALPLLEVNDDAKGNPLGSRLPKCYGVPV